MYQFIQNFIQAGLILLIVIGVAVVNAAIGMFSKKEFTVRDRALSV
jgi:hypothetical protein